MDDDGDVSNDTDLPSIWVSLMMNLPMRNGILMFRSFRACFTDLPSFRYLDTFSFRACLSSSCFSISSLETIWSSSPICSFFLTAYPLFSISLFCHQFLGLCPSLVPCHHHHLSLSSAHQHLKVALFYHLLAFVSPFLLGNYPLTYSKLYHSFFTKIRRYIAVETTPKVQYFRPTILTSDIDMFILWWKYLQGCSMISDA